MIGYIVIIGFFSLLGMFITRKLKSTFIKYGRTALFDGLAGKEVAQMMLDHYGVKDVKIIPRKGSLTDHYNPLTKTIALSEPVYNSISISAAAVAAHECGHAIQHAQAYKAMSLRTLLVPLIKFSSRVQQLLFFGIMMGIGTEIMTSNLGLMILTVTFGMTALFALVTLPVEFDASRRALAWLDETDVAKDGLELEGAKQALKWAAMTYISQALSALVIFLYFGWQLVTNKKKGGFV